MHPYKRSRRVEALLQEEVASVIRHDLGERDLESVTITGVSLADDLKSGIIHYCLFGPSEKRDMVQELLQHHTGHIKVALGKRVRLKYMPDLRFRYDETADRGDRIDSILDRIRDQEGGGDES